jgi:hypothetical protein
LKELADRKSFDALPASSWLALQYLESNWNSATLDALVAKGSVVLEEDEFGDQKAALVSTGNSIQSLQMVSSGGLLPSQTDAASLMSPKLQLVAMCLRLGWAFGKMGAVIGESLPKIIDTDAVLSNRAFWAVAASLEAIISRGLTKIYTRMPAKYYEYVFSCGDYTLLLAQGDQIRNWSHEEWVGSIAGKDPTSAAASTAAVVDAHAVADDEQEEGSVVIVPVLPPQIPSELQSARTRMIISRPPVVWTTRDGVCLHVNFDGCSHQSGMPRCYVDCAEHAAEGCVKYRFIHHFPSARDCVSWLFAWRIDGYLSADRSSHVASEPSSESLAHLSLHCPDVQDD